MPSFNSGYFIVTALDLRLLEEAAWLHEYQAFVLNADRQIIHHFKFSSPDNRTARLHAKQSVQEHDVELWQLERWVATFAPVRSPPLQSEGDPCLLDSSAYIPVRCDVSSGTGRTVVASET